MTSLKREKIDFSVETCDLAPGRSSRAVTFKKELGRVQFPRNFFFLAKIRRKIRFYVRRFQFQRFKLGFLDSSKYSTSTNSKISKGTNFVFKKITKYFPCRQNTTFRYTKNNVKSFLRLPNMICAIVQVS